jgi:hypothetical protein
MTMLKIYERVLRRILKEDSSSPPNVTDLAMCIKRAPKRFTGTLYSVSAMLGALAGGSSMTSEDRRDYAAVYRAIQPTVRGNFVMVHPEPKPYEGNCAGAWQIKQMAGPRYAKQLYGSAYALSPSGLVVPDRFYVSSKAGRSWRKAFSDKRAAVQLVDDESSPNVCVLHSPDDEDCRGEDRSWLNWAYKAVGWEEGMLQKLEAAHEETMQDLTHFFGGSKLVSLITSAGDSFFGEHFQDEFDPYA